MLYPSKLHRYSMQMMMLSYSNLDLTCIEEWSSSFALSKGLASSAMWDAEEPNRRQKQCISPPPFQLCQDANTLQLEIDGGCVTFTQSFKYLGSILTSDLDDSTEVEARIKSASAAFASMRLQSFSSKYVKPAHKAQTYESIVMGLLLYGSETWSLTEQLKTRLRSFHHRCVRAMYRINL